MREILFSIACLARSAAGWRASQTTPQRWSWVKVDNIILIGFEMNFAALSRQPEDDFEESSNVYDSLLNVSQEGAGFQTQMAIGLSLSEVREIFIYLHLMFAH